jgi:hypothetical protein
MPPKERESEADNSSVLLLLKSNYCTVRTLYDTPSLAVAIVGESIIHTARPGHSWQTRTPPTHPRVTPPTAHHADAVRPEEQANDTYYTFTQYKATSNHNKSYVASFALFRETAMVDVLNDTSNETSDRKRRSIEKSDGESHSRRDPFGVPRSLSGGMRLERRDQNE